MRFRDLQNRRTMYVDKTLSAGSAHDLAVRHVLRSDARSVLDLGCAQGFVGERVKALAPQVKYDGADRGASPPVACDRYWSCDLERTFPAVDPFDYDLVLCLDVLEHLREPETFLLRLRRSHRIHQKTTFLFSTANVAFISIRLGLLFGRFEYGDRGILDITHRRLMTKSSFMRMIRETGFSIEEVRGTPVPFHLAFGERAATRCATGFWRLLVAILPGLFAFQTMVVARARPSIPDVELAAEEERAFQASERRVGRGAGRR